MQVHREGQSLQRVSMAIIAGSFNYFDRNKPLWLPIRDYYFLKEWLGQFTKNPKNKWADLDKGSSDYMSVKLIIIRPKKERQLNRDPLVLVFKAISFPSWQDYFEWLQCCAILQEHNRTHRATLSQPFSLSPSVGLGRRSEGPHLDAGTLGEGYGTKNSVL